MDPFAVTAMSSSSCCSVSFGRRAVVKATFVPNEGTREMTGFHARRRRERNPGLRPHGVPDAKCSTLRERPVQGGATEPGVDMQARLSGEKPDARPQLLAVAAPVHDRFVEASRIQPLRL